MEGISTNVSIFCGDPFVVVVFFARDSGKYLCCKC